VRGPQGTPFRFPLRQEPPEITIFLEYAELPGLAVHDPEPPQRIGDDVPHALNHVGS